ncbi:isoprenyl transferase [Tenuifilum thalassicum]|uniref:Isoprenyl transferase n=1 Tax=Tenuifilum thalassicum TaxID=2590900 RepID=A0A7D4CFG3_9BACT|nr:isoprenyl transferase [Tenuifilum thalassicum]QKG79006.1 isoprenyl transferase [Tenuifilum thalassicum]
MTLKEQIDKTRVPKHVAIIMDGNGRWAKKRGNQRIFGHRNGVNAVKAATEAAGEIGVKYLTLYAFSTENWNRPKSEVDALMSLLVETINSEMNTLLKNGIRVLTIGDITKLPKEVQKKLIDIKEKTAHCETITTVLALNYGARYEITEAVKKISNSVKNGDLNPEDISINTISENLDTANIPDPDLLIRTSGELRLSNFLLWQLAYAELYFTPVLWPDFTKDDFFKAIIDYQKRERRFGKTSEQL